MADASLPALIGTDYPTVKVKSPDQGSAQGEGGIQEPRNSQPIETMRAEARPGDPGTGLEMMGKSLEGIAEQQEQAQATTWLANSKNQFELQGRQLLNQMDTTRAPGQMIGTDYAKKLQTLQTQSSDSIKDNPGLQNLWNEHSAGIIGQLSGEAQQSDFKARDVTIKHNMANADDLGAKIIASYNNKEDYDRIDQVAQRLTGQAHSTALDAQISLPDKMNAIDNSTQNFAYAANIQKMQVDPDRWFREHAQSFPPEIQKQMGYAPVDPNNLKATATQLHDAYSNGFGSKDTVESLMDGHSANDINQIAAQMGVKPTDRLNLNDPQQLHAMTSAVTRINNNNAMPYSPEQQAWATNEAINSAGALPPANVMDHTGLHPTGDILFDSAKFDTQQKIQNAFLSLQAQKNTVNKGAKDIAEIQLSDAISDMETGKPIPDSVMQDIGKNVTEANDPSLSLKFAKAQDQSAYRAEAITMSTPQIISMINSIHAMPPSTDNEDKAAFLSRFLQKRQEGIKNNPQQYDRDTGTIVQPLKIESTPDGQASAAARSAYATQAQSKYGGDRAEYLLGPEDKILLTNQLSGADNTTKMATLKALNQNFNQQDYQSIINKIRPDNPSVAYQGDLYALNRSQQQQTNFFTAAPTPLSSADVANRIGIGNDLRDPTKGNKEGKFAMPSDKLLRDASSGYLSNISNANQADMTFGAMKDYYAWASQRDKDYSGEINPQRSDEAWKAVLGEQNRKTIMPWGMTSSQFNDKFAQVAPKQVATQWADVDPQTLNNADLEAIPMKGSPMSTGLYKIKSGNGYVLNTKTKLPVIINLNEK